MTEPLGLRDLLAAKDAEIAPRAYSIARAREEISRLRREVAAAEAAALALAEDAANEIAAAMAKKGMIGQRNGARKCSEAIRTISRDGSALQALIAEAEARGRAQGEAAALERAAKECDRIAGNTADFSRDHRRAAGQCAAMIRAFPRDGSALDRIKAEAHRAGVREAAGIAAELAQAAASAILAAAEHREADNG